MTRTQNLRVFTTYPHPCSYLEDQEATTLFVDPHADLDASTYSRLSEHGFRRSGSHLYRPHCEHCQACIPVRIPVDAFRPDRNQKRIVKRNQDLETVFLDDIATEQCFQLYCDYINERHADGDMYPPSWEQYRSFLGSQWGVTRYVGFYLERVLKAVAIVDVMDNGLSAIYTFFDPHEGKRSLGIYAILWQIGEAQRRGLPAVYLGYWIRNCRKMNYKSRFRPMEILHDGHWRLVT